MLGLYVEASQRNRIFEKPHIVAVRFVRVTKTHWQEGKYTQGDRNSLSIPDDHGVEYPRGQHLFPQCRRQPFGAAGKGICCLANNLPVLLANHFNRIRIYKRCDLDEAGCVPQMFLRCLRVTKGKSTLACVPRNGADRVTSCLPTTRCPSA